MAQASASARPRRGFATRVGTSPRRAAPPHNEDGYMNKGTAIVGFLLCFLAGGMLMYGVDRSGATAHKGDGDSIGKDTSPGGPWSDEDAAVPVSSKDPVWGNRNAPVTLVIFSDFQCPFCTRVEATVNQLKEKYGKDKLRIVWKSNPLPFHPNAKPASIAAEAVFRLGGSAAFWKFHDTAFANQKDLSPENYEKWAVECGVDKAKFKELVGKPELAAKVDADMAVGKSAGVTGTPASFINGVFLSGAQPLDKFTSIVDEQLNAAKAALASGTKPEKLYVKLANENKAKGPAPSDNKKPEQPQKPAEDDKTVWKVPVGNSMVKGKADALVTIVEFSDFQCPFCGRVEPTLTEIEKTYGDKVRVVWKHNPLPFHPRAEPASELTMEAFKQKGSAGFWAAHALLFKKECQGKADAKDKQSCDAAQGKWIDNQVKLNDEDLLGYAKELKLDEAKVKSAIAEKRYLADITADQDLADDLQANGTPHFFINGRRLVGAQPVDKFKTVIDEEIKKAEAMLAKGVKAANLYNELIKDGKEPPPPEKKTVDAPAADSPWKGSEKAKVVMEIFSDFQCPFCKRVEDQVKQVEKNYGDKVRIVWRHKPLPMHQDAPLASEASQEVFKQKGRDAFWKFHDLLFDKQGAPDALKRPALESYAEQAGVDMTKFKKALDDHAHKAFVDSESAVADKAQISGTPAFVIGSVEKGQINGYFISGAQPYPKFKKVIDKALKEAEKK
jgi:protein-disulfide isomerase